jgi:2'-5' RNA ligase
MSLYLAVEISDADKKKLAAKQVYLKQNCVEGEFEDPTRFHITVRFISEGQEQHEKIIEALTLWEQTCQPKKFEILAKNFGKFPQGVMWIGVNECLPLYQAKYQIEECCQKVGNQLRKDDHPNYIPHITMGYDVQESPTLNKEFEGIPIVVDNISLWNGFKANDVYIHNKLFDIKLK